MDSSEAEFDHILSLKRLRGAAITVVIGWATQFLLAWFVLRLDQMNKAENPYLSIILFTVSPVVSYLGMAYLAGLMYSTFAPGTIFSRSYLQVEVWLVWGVTLLPLTLIAWFIGLPAFLITMSRCRAGLNWGLDNWPLKPWEVWFSQWTPDPPLSR